MKIWANPSLVKAKGWTALSALINKLTDCSKNEIFSSFQFVDLASIAFALDLLFYDNLFE
ncbi:hypothetical protein LEP1GSC193_3656 [Leptospira alstonii serovar Pingchang str. 80-412]|uniref:Uncharacterized protein n=2 Tax=Leptospira alstonii TaxID=28452 RepID=M6CLQ8_9LEPT|nr:hypothetical protein LEP1GSC194_3415 [Leptospira alstonii serovar Sichuan str. 79601]EQA81299.1 hypothetical protein LEP1GSC193_3656 [Leptospira alstonii serovar Pingchang str. 80-412]